MNTEKLEAALRDLRTVVKLPGEECIADEELVRRYVDEREEAAFAALMRRYGPMVLRVCYRVLRRSHDAEDAFQATFLTLAREAGSLRRQGAVGAWIHDVAFHAALRESQRISRRRYAEERHEPPKNDEAADEGMLREDVQVALYEELHRLPEKYRIPLVMCNLMGRSQEDVARELGLHRTALSKRLRCAYSQLRQRLLSRGISLSMILLASLVHEEGKAASMPAALLLRTVRAALDPTSISTSASAAVLAASGASGYLSSSVYTKYFLLALVLLLAGGGYWAERTWNAPRPEQAGAIAVLPPPASSARHTNRGMPPNGEQATLSGIVVDPVGSPVAGAEVAVFGLRSLRSGKRNVQHEVLARGRSDEAGRFHLDVPRSDTIWSLRTAFVHLWVAASGHAPVTIRLPWRPDSPPVEVRLLPPDVIRGQLLDDRDRPATQVRVFASQVGDICLEPIEEPNHASPNRPAHWPVPVTTDAEGRFTLRGLNLKQGVGLHVCDDRYALRKVLLEPSRWSNRVGTLRLASARLLEGRIIAVGGMPQASAQLNVTARDVFGRVRGSALQTRTNASGVFRVHLPVADSYRVEAFAADGAPFLGIAQDVPWPADAARRDVELTLPRGILVRGVVTDAESGMPVPGAYVQFRSLDAWAVPAGVLTGMKSFATGGADGRFRLVVPKAAGLLLVHEASGDYATEEWDDRLPNTSGRIHANRVLAVDAAHGAEVREVRVALRRGVSINGRVIGPDGEPVARGAWLCRGRTCPQKPTEGQPQLFWDGRFTLRGCLPGRVYPVLFLDSRRRLGAQVELVAETDKTKPIEVRLQPCGAAEARFVDARGRPVAGYQPFLYVMVPSGRLGDDEDDAEPAPAEMHELDEFDPDHYREGPKTDAEGRVTLPALIPGARYRMSRWVDAAGAWREFQTAAGQTLSLPDVVLHDRH